MTDYSSTPNPSEPSKSRCWTIREEANALTCSAFRNGFLEDLHAGEQSELLDDPKLSRITDEEMKKLMIQSSNQLAKLLAMKENDPAAYWEFIAKYFNAYCRRWEREPAFGLIDREKPAWVDPQRPQQ